MPALNIPFTAEELDRLRAQAQAENRSMTSLAHDMIVDNNEQFMQNRMVMAASARVMALSSDLLKRLADR